MIKMKMMVVIAAVRFCGRSNLYDWTEAVKVANLMSQNRTCMHQNFASLQKSKLRANVLLLDSVTVLTERKEPKKSLQNEKYVAGNRSFAIS